MFFSPIKKPPKYPNIEKYSPVIVREKYLYLIFKTLEICVGTNRNIKYYKPDASITFLDWSPNMIQMAMSKLNPFIKCRYVVDNIK